MSAELFPERSLMSVTSIKPSRNPSGGHLESRVWPNEVETTSCDWASRVCKARCVIFAFVIANDGGIRGHWSLVGTAREISV
jgi:hypothetical protein